MRFKLILSVHAEKYGNVLPISYQYELSAAIYHRVRDHMDDYTQWLSSNGFTPTDDLRHRLFSYSNLYIPRIRVEGDRLAILVKKVQMWVSFLPVRGTQEFVQQLFSGMNLVLGDKRSRVALEVEQIVESPAPNFEREMSYLALSPIVFMEPRSNRSIEYIGPDNPGYLDRFKQNLLNKYEQVFGVPYEGELNFSWELLSEPKRKGIFVMRFTPDETKVIGYMYKFKLIADPIFHQIIYETGVGDRGNWGFGCIEILRKEDANAEK